jgi:hypothetical protein
MTMILSPAHKKPVKPETTRAEDDRDHEADAVSDEPVVEGSQPDAQDSQP